MPAVTTAAMIGGIVTYIGAQLSQNKSVKQLFNDCTDTTAAFLDRLLFKPDGSEKEALQSLKAKPDSKARQGKLKSEFDIALEEEEGAAAAIKELFEKMSKTEDGGKVVTTIINSKNVVTGNVNVGGNFHVGDNYKPTTDEDTRL